MIHLILSFFVSAALAGSTSIQDGNNPRNKLVINTDGSINIGGVGLQGLVGPQGLQGPVGATGPSGSAGAQGTKGDTGSQGVKGDTGIQGSVGTKGDTGSQGVKGDTGSIGPGVPSGGGTNQTLQKKSASDYDTQWIDLTHNSLSGIQGGASSDYQHLTTHQVTALGNAVPNTVTVNAHALSGNVVISGSDITTGTLVTGVGGTNLTTYTKGDILHASAANVLGKLALGSVGQLLGVDPSGVPAWQNAIDTQLNHPEVRDDFIAQSGDTPWTMSQTTGAGVGPGITTNLHPGVAVFLTAALTNGRATIYKSYNPGTLFLANGVFTFETICQIPTLSTGTDEFAWRFGLFNNPIADPTAGITINYDRAVNGNFWAAKTAGTGGYNTLVFDGGSGRATLAAVAGDWMHFQFVVNAAGTSVSFYGGRNGAAMTLLGTINAANAIPQGGLGVAYYLQKSAGTTSVLMNLDLHYHRYDLTNAR